MAVGGDVMADGELFPSRGEMAGLMRDKDWAETALGPVASWPLSLRTIVRLMLTSRYAMWMGWGKDLLFFYNDAYREQTLGKKHPWALGQPARDVWAEIWDVVGPRADRVIDTGDATWDEGLLLFLERSGFVEETYHTFSYSPVPDDAGATVGMFCVVIEDTERVVGERRLKLLGDFATRLGQVERSEDVFAAVSRVLDEEARDVPFSLTYLFDEDATARLASCSGIDRTHPCAPEVIGPGADAPWPAGPLFEGGRGALVELDATVGWPTGPWKTPPKRALVVPIASQGQTRPLGFFVAAQNPHRPSDDAARSFVELFVGQLAAALGNARAYAAERQRAEALAELDRAKTAFFSNVSHEFRTPLTLMLGPLDDALRDPSSVTTKGRAQLEVVRRNGLRLLRLVNSLLDFSRIEAGRAQATFAPTDVGALTADLTSNFRSAIEKTKIALMVDCPSTGSVLVDREMWEKIVFNLVSNAFKHTFEGKIAVSLRDEGGELVLIVEDTGVGIPESELPHLFERFHRVRGARSRTHEGTGIGLALVQELVRLHGGTIAVTSAIGVGTTVTVRVPRVAGPAVLPEPAPTKPSLVGRDDVAQGFVAEATRWLVENDATGSAAPVADGRARILVADDNADMRDYIARLLGERWEIDTATDGDRALTLARERRPDLILSDVMMPGTDGFQLLAALRADPVLQTTPVILLSARAGEESVVEGIEAGADDYLVKPFAAKELLARVRGALTLSALRRDKANLVLELEKAVSDMLAQREVLDLALKAARMAAWSYDPRTDVVTAASNAGAVYGTTELDEGKNAITHVHPDDVAAHRTVIQAALRDGSSYESAFRYVRPSDNEVVHLHDYVIVLHDESGAPSRVVGVTMDVTGRIEADQALRRSEARFRAVQEASPDGFMILSSVRAADGTIEDFRWVWANAAAEQVVGRSSAELEGKRLLVEMPSRRLDGLFDAYVAVVETGEPFRREIAFASDGGERWFDALAVRLDDGFAVAFADVTARKRLELELESQRARLNEVFAKAPAIVGVLSAPDQRWVLVNPRIDALLNGRSLLGRTLRESMPELETHPFPGIVDRVIATGERFVADEMVANLDRNNDGHPVRGYFNFVCEPLPDDEGNVAQVLVFAIEVTEQVEARERILDLATRERAAREAAEEASRLKDEFLATVSHELRTPLQSILGWSTLLQRDGIDAAKVRKGLTTIERNARSQAQLVEDLLDVSRIISGKLRIDARPTDVDDLVRAAVETVKSAAEAKGVSIVVTAAADTGSIVADRDRLQQIVWNLVSNGVKFTPAGGMVVVESRRTEDELEIAVTDTGKGIEASFLPHVFDRFRQAEGGTNRSFGGLGLGLAIVRHLVELHGGRVTAESAGPDKGARFVVRLPLRGARHRSEAPGPGNGQSPNPTRALAGLRVLLVEDETDSRELLATVLTVAGADVRAVASGDEALRIIEELSPHVVVSDIGMPGEDGYAFIEHLRALPTDVARVPAVAVTAYARGEDRRRALAAGFGEHIAKPVEPGVLVELVRHLAASV